MGVHTVSIAFGRFVLGSPKSSSMTIDAELNTLTFESSDRQAETNRQTDRQRRGGVKEG